MRLITWGRTAALAFALTACASDGAPEGDDSSRGGASAGAAGQSGAASAGSATAGASLTGGAASAGSNSGGATGALAGSSGSSGNVAGGSCREDVPDAEWEANCLGCAAGDACASCACQSCAAEIHVCEDTPGCLEIAACVKLTSCVGVDCYCGTDTAATCANGGGNGPCKAAILNAPGGKAPTLLQPSGGPASDAVTALATCMQDMSKCGSLCN